MATHPSALPAFVDPSVADAITDALEKHKQVAEEIKVVAEELGVVHGVLDTQIPSNMQPDDLIEAVARTDALEKRLNESTKMLSHATEMLEHEVKALQASTDSQSAPSFLVSKLGSARNPRFKV